MLGERRKLRGVQGAGIASEVRMGADKSREDDVGQKRTYEQLMIKNVGQDFK